MRAPLFRLAGGQGAAPTVPPAQGSAVRLAVGGAAAVVLAAILVQLSPAAQAALELDRDAIAAGQWWRLLACHLVHWGWPHLAADMAAFVTLCWLARDRPRYLWAVAVVSAVVVGLTVHAAAGDITSYRGMSGVDYALLGWVLVASAARAWPAGRTACLCLLAATAGKIAWCLATGGALPGVGLPDGVAVVGIAHAAGLAIGTAAALAQQHVRRRVPTAGTG